MLINEGDRCIQRVHGHHRENRAQRILLHDGIGFCHVRQNGGCFTQRGEKSFSTASHRRRDAAATPPPPLTDVFLCFYHLSTHSHLARPPQQVFSTVKELQIDHAAVAAGLCWIGTVELHHAALQSLHEACFDVGVAQDIVGSHQTLSGVVETGPSDALSRSADFAVFINITGVL